MAERLTVRVLRMAPEGQAVAKAEGSPRVIFVAGGAPGDVAEVEVTEAKSKPKERERVSPSLLITRR